jgi:hypothetical protein
LNGPASSPQKEYGYRSGQLLVTAEPSANIHWLVTDHLGTPRIVLDLTGSLANVTRHDYLPFGEELFAGTGGRTPQQGYSASDAVRQHFTSKERDIETGSITRLLVIIPTPRGGSRCRSLRDYFEMERGRDAEEQQEMLLEYLVQPQNWANTATR